MKNQTPTAISFELTVELQGLSRPEMSPFLRKILPVDIVEVFYIELRPRHLCRCIPFLLSTVVDGSSTHRQKWRAETPT
jgi:hypothetical protein